MAEARTTHTLVASEAAWRRPVLALCAATLAIDAAAFALASRTLAVLPLSLCALPCLALVASNMHYLVSHHQTTIGMIPPALVSVGPAALAVVLSGAPELVRHAFAWVFLLALAVAVFISWWFCQLRAAYAHPEPIAPNAALIVLGGAIKHGGPCATLALRLDAAARLWHESPQRTIVASGGPTPDGTTTETAEMARYLQGLGVDRSSILQESEARNTQQNVELSCKLLDERGLACQHCVVSNDYHLYRALHYAARMGQELVPVPAPTPAGSALQQWCREVITILAGR